MSGYCEFDKNLYVIDFCCDLPNDGKQKQVKATDIYLLQIFCKKYKAIGENQVELVSELESDLRETVDRGRNWLVDFNAEKTQLVQFDGSNNTGAIDVRVNGSVLVGKSSSKMLGLTCSSKLDWGSYIISMAKTTACKKIEVLIRSVKFYSPEFALYLYKSTICPCMECCCHVWDGSPSCYLELLDQLQKRISRYVGP